MNSIKNIAEASNDQFLALSPYKGMRADSLNSAISLKEKEMIFLNDCQKIQNTAKEKLAKLKEYKINSQSIVDRLSAYTQALSLNNLSPVIIDGTYSVSCNFRPYMVETCGLCGHHENISYDYTVINLKQPSKNQILFQKINLHAIAVHKNFSYPGKIGCNEGHELSVFNAIKILQLKKEMK